MLHGAGARAPSVAGVGCLGCFGFGERQLRLALGLRSDDHLLGLGRRDAFRHDHAALRLDDGHGVGHRAAALLVFRTAQRARVSAGSLGRLERVVVVRGRRRDADVELGDGRLHHRLAEAGVAEIGQLRQELEETCIGVLADALGHDVLFLRLSALVGV